jgi:hypothetical protein
VLGGGVKDAEVDRQDQESAIHNDGDDPEARRDGEEMMMGGWGKRRDSPHQLDSRHERIGCCLQLGHVLKVHTPGETDRQDTQLREEGRERGRERRGGRGTNNRRGW